MSFAAGLLIVASLAFAEDLKSAPLMQTLPADGTWSTLSVTVDSEGQSVPLTWTIRSVGREMHDGKPCRYIEMEQVCDNGPQQVIIYFLGNATWRLLIPEDAFGEGKDPMAKAVQTWHQQDKSEPMPVASIAAQDPLFAAILMGPKADLKPEAVSEKIAWQRGEWECQVLGGTQNIDFAGVTLQMNTRILRHRDAPFSTAGTRQELKATVAGNDYRVRIKATLRDYGKDAKAKLPQLVP